MPYIVRLMHFSIACRCTLVEEAHFCSTLPARNTVFTYPHQILPNNTIIPSESIVTSFSFLPWETLNPLCETSFRHIICLYPRPPCSNETNLLLPICPESCLAFSRLIEEKRCDEELLAIAKAVNAAGTPAFIITLGILAQFQCQNVQTYYFLGDAVTSYLDPNRCTDLFTPNQTCKP